MCFYKWAIDDMSTLGSMVPGWRGACQIPKRYYDLRYQLHAFEILR